MRLGSVQAAVEAAGPLQPLLHVHPMVREFCAATYRLPEKRRLKRDSELHWHVRTPCQIAQGEVRRRRAEFLNPTVERGEGCHSERWQLTSRNGLLRLSARRNDRFAPWQAMASSDRSGLDRSQEMLTSPTQCAGRTSKRAERGVFSPPKTDNSACR